MIRGPVAEISLSAIAHNLRTVKKIIRNRPVIAVVKADAYGHGVVEVSKKLIREGVYCLAVSYAGEARELRDAGITAPILVLFDRGEIRDYFDLNLIPVIHNLDNALKFSAEARKRRSKIKVHIKVDTGMGRMGLTGPVFSELKKIGEMPGLHIEGLLSHFSEADLLDRSYAIHQLELFRDLQKTFSGTINRKVFSHIANSAAVLTFRESYLDAVRPGLMLYGYNPLGAGMVKKAMMKGPCRNLQARGSLIPAMTVKTHILSVRDLPSGTPVSYGRTFVTGRPSRIGVVPLGYADGYSRLLSNNSEMLVRGKRVPVVGRVCMDLTMVDLTDVKNARANDEVVILGKQGEESITADDIACRANTISYEILTSLGNRSKRVYV